MTDTLRSPNRDRLLRTAHLLRPLLSELVFVGGQVAELLVTDPAAVRVRPTDDVDVVVSVTTRTAYHALQQRLMALGFTPDHRAGAPVCRMRTADDLLLDVMPLDEAILGFSNRWYSYAFASAATLTLEPGLDVRVASAAAFLAMKWEAFFGIGMAMSDAPGVPGQSAAVGSSRPRQHVAAAACLMRGARRGSARLASESASFAADSRVPEPSTNVLMVNGFTRLAGFARRRDPQQVMSLGTCSLPTRFIGNVVFFGNQRLDMQVDVLEQGRSGRARFSRARCGHAAAGYGKARGVDDGQRHPTR